MDKLKALEFIESSFLKELLENKDITDISYNGESLYYLDNNQGRCKSLVQLDEQVARDFIRQIANLSEKQFSYQSPKLDVSIGRYRINALHPSIPRRRNENVLNFSIRLASNDLLINDRSTFLNAKLISLLKVIIKSNKSIVIGGMTGSGKTEFQKYLLTKLPTYSRVIVIDNILELDTVSIDKDIDLNIWQADEKNKEATIQELVRNALRSNPDWLIVAESRGKEMVEVLNSAMTGHPIITTLHATSLKTMPTRIARMVLMNEQKQDISLLMSDIYYNFNFYIYLRREINKDGKVTRFIEEVALIDQKGTFHPLYKKKKDEEIYYQLDKDALSLLDYEDEELFKQTFTKGEK